MPQSNGLLNASIMSPLFDLEKRGYYSCAVGHTNARYVPFTDSAKHIYMQIFAILEYFNIEYFVFAGTLVGYVRNGKMPAWMDDIDVMIFEKDIPLFEEEVVPYFLKCGFNCKTVAKQFSGGGYHVLALQQGGRRDLSIDFSVDVTRSVPWAQFDVFFSNVDDKNHIRNVTGWGLYHRKDVPLDWVFPGQKIEMDGMTFKTFSNIEQDVQKEYGDVHNQLVVKTHNTDFLSAKHMPWDIADTEFNRIMEATVSYLTPSLTQEAYDAYAPVAGKKCTPPDSASFDEIMCQTIRENASSVHLAGENQSFWVMDIKRLLPDINITIAVSSLLATKRAAHMKQFIDEVIISGPGLARQHTEMISALTDVFGEQQFPSLPQPKVTV